VIYYLYDPETDLLKVGWTGRDVESRIAEHESKVGRRLNLVAAHPGDRRDETRIKRRLADYRAHSPEWFHAGCRAVQSFVGVQLAAPGPKPAVRFLDPRPEPRVDRVPGAKGELGFGRSGVGGEDPLSPPPKSHLLAPRVSPPTELAPDPLGLGLDLGVHLDLGLGEMSGG